MYYICLYNSTKHEGLAVLHKEKKDSIFFKHIYKTKSLTFYGEELYFDMKGVKSKNSNTYILQLNEKQLEFWKKIIDKCNLDY